MHFFFIVLQGCKLKYIYKWGANLDDFFLYKLISSTSYYTVNYRGANMLQKGVIYTEPVNIVMYIIVNCSGY